jgi:hypothetical protein
MGGRADRGVSAVMLCRAPLLSKLENTIDSPDPVEKKEGAEPADKSDDRPADEFSIKWFLHKT